MHVVYDRVYFMKVLITGGCGFIGSNFIHHLHANYSDAVVYNIDILNYAGNPANLVDIKDRHFFIEGDIADRPLINSLFKQHAFDVVFNFAAESHVDRSIIDSQNFIRSNIQGTHALLDAIRTYHTPLMVHISTDEVYGDRKERGPAHEETLLVPSNPYSASKAGADFLAQAYIRTYNLPVIIIRGCNNFGPYQYPEKLMPLTITNILERQHIPLHGNGNQIRTWIYVKDFCRAIDAIWQKGKPGEIFNVGGQEKTNKDIVQTIHKEMNARDMSRIIPVTDRPGQDTHYALNWDKLKKSLGWEHAYRFDDALMETVGWYTKNTEWWKEIKQTVGFKEHWERQSRGLWG